MVASHNGHVEVVDKLIQHGARVDLKDNVCVIITYVNHHLILLTGRVACSDVCISEWAHFSVGKAATTWSKSGLTNTGIYYVAMVTTGLTPLYIHLSKIQHSIL